MIYFQRKPFLQNFMKIGGVVSEIQIIIIFKRIARLKNKTYLYGTKNKTKYWLESKH